MLELHNLLVAILVDMDMTATLIIQEVAEAQVQVAMEIMEAMEMVEVMEIWVLDIHLI